MTTQPAASKRTAQAFVAVWLRTPSAESQLLHGDVIGSVSCCWHMASSNCVSYIFYLCQAAAMRGARLAQQCWLLFRQLQYTSWVQYIMCWQLVEWLCTVAGLRCTETSIECCIV